jgi:hypothetical protein
VKQVTPNNLGLACTDQGLLLGRTPLIERRDGRFVVRGRSDIECLFSLAYGRAATAQRLMPGLATGTTIDVLESTSRSIVNGFRIHKK